ncbi:hypothetical protein [Roseiconus lacunae]|uniref:hypothetical protein n=1 Tax=Roseiconus lacunae TaxID=2605694 RepID=UPI001E425492|nr:hypothetical protein [Roseiconus lacunae]MCD0457842.1 hypothetical protein [Roseiconus lacunae]
MMRCTLILIACILCPQPLCSKGPPGRTFWAFTYESNGICRAILFPSDMDVAATRLEQIPISYKSGDLGVWQLRDGVRFNESITFNELLKSDKLEGLELSYMNLRDREFELVSKCRTLRYLYLPGVRLSDAMIESLGQMPQLAYVNVYDSNLSARELKELAARLPNVKIETSKPTGLATIRDGTLHLVLNK